MRKNDALTWVVTTKVTNPQNQHTQPRGIKNAAPKGGRTHTEDVTRENGERQIWLILALLAVALWLPQVGQFIEAVF